MLSLNDGDGSPINYNKMVKKEMEVDKDWGREEREEGARRKRGGGEEREEEQYLLLHHGHYCVIH